MRRLVVLLTLLAATAALAVPASPAGAVDTAAVRNRLAPYAKSGPYAVGVTTLSLDDRKVEVWYPVTKRAAKGEPRDTYYLRDWLPPAIQSLLEQKDINPPFRTNAVRDVRAASGGPFPFIFFAHGAGGYRDQSTFLTTHLATWGFVVASPDFLERGLAAALGQQPAIPKTNVQVYEATLAAVRAANRAPKSPIRGAVNTRRVVTTGHSAGGRAAIEIAAARPEVIASIPMAAAAAGGTVGTTTIPPVQAPEKPSLYLAGAQDGVIPLSTIQAYYDTVPAPKRSVWIDGSGHLTAFSDICAIGAGGGGVVALAQQAGLPVPANLARLGQDGCLAPAPKPQTLWPVTDHFVTAQARWAFRIDKLPKGLNKAAALAFRPVKVTYSQTLR